MEAGGSQRARQSQRNHPHLQDSIRGSSLIHLSCELVVMGRKGRVYEKKTRNGLKAWMSKRVLRSLGLSLQESGACSLQGPYKEALSHHFFPARAEQEP